MNWLGIALVAWLVIQAISSATKCRPQTQQGYDHSALMVLCLFGAYVIICLMGGWVR